MINNINIDVEQVKQLQDNNQNFVLIDVREIEEWEDGYIAGAVHIPKGLIERDITKYAPDKNTKIILYCRSGTRSFYATQSLLSLGYTDVHNMQGGIIAWSQANFEILTD
jgi:rhodanese-related sulfurtransferase